MPLMTTLTRPILSTDARRWSGFTVNAMKHLLPPNKLLLVILAVVWFGHCLGYELYRYHARINSEVKRLVSGFPFVTLIFSFYWPISELRFLASKVQITRAGAKEV